MTIDERGGGEQHAGDHQVNAGAEPLRFDVAEVPGRRVTNV